MLAHHWKNWLTSSELAQELGLSKRRANQILKFYLGLGIIDMNVMVKYPDEKRIFVSNTYVAPIYRCKYARGYEYESKEI